MKKKVKKFDLKTNYFSKNGENEKKMKLNEDNIRYEKKIRK